MLAAGLRVTQIALVALCVLVAFSGVRALVSAAPVPDVPAPPSFEVEDGEPDFERYLVIQTRNLFQSAATEDLPPPPEFEEELEESKLRLRLLGTTASETQELSVASIEDLVANHRLAVRVGDPVAGATLVRVERHRVVIDNHGTLEQLSLDDNPPPRASSPSLQRTRERGQRARNRKPPSAPTSELKKRGLQRSRVAQAAQAGAIGRIMRSITSGEELGLAPGERVTAIDGFDLSDRQQVEELMGSLDQEGPRQVTVATPDGGERVIEVDAR